MILDLRIRWVERFKRALNHYHNGIKDAKRPTEKIRFLMIPTPEVVAKFNVNKDFKKRAWKNALTAADASLALKIELKKIYELVKLGYLKTRWKGQYIFTRDEIVRYYKENKK